MHEAFYKPLFKSMYRFGRDIETLCYFCILLPSKANCMMALIWVGSFSIASDRIRKVSSSTIASRKKHLLFWL